MNIRARITARKVVISFLYWHLILVRALQKGELGFSDFFAWENDDVKENTKKYLYVDPANTKKNAKEIFAFLAEICNKDYIEQKTIYILDEFFSYNTTPHIDYSYILLICKRVFIHSQKAYEDINGFTTTFVMERMDTMDQAIFLLWYAEQIELDTPKEILINEMIELAKRYGDVASPKLVNGIFHKLFGMWNKKKK